MFQEAVREETASQDTGAPFASLAQSAIDAPRVLGDYEILETVAHGGMGVVYRARQRSLNRLVALKMLLGGTYAGLDFKRRFRQEAESVAQLQHPGIVPVYEIGEYQGQLYYSMELVCDRSGRPAPTLNTVLRQGPLLPQAAAKILVDVADAVHYAHGQGIIHRDLKPSNLLVGADGRPRVTDFGLARRLGDDSNLTVTGQALGTPGFLPPEQAGGVVGAAGVHSDVYSLGAVLYCLLSGRPPFLAGSLHETIQQVLHSEPVPLRRLNSALPADLETIAARCLEKDPSRRYASAAEVSEELRRFLDRRPIQAVPAGAIQRAGKWCQRNPVVAGLLATVLFVFGTGFGSALWQWREARANAISAFQARDDAEALVDYMMKDLKREFEAVGKLEILDGVHKRVADYYRSLPSRPNDPTYRRRQATFLRNQGNLLEARGNLAEASGVYSNALSMLAHAGSEIPAVDSAPIYFSLLIDEAGIQRALGGYVRSLEVYRHALACADSFLGRNPSDLEWQRRKMIALKDCGVLYESQGDLLNARAVYSTNLTISGRLLELQATNLEFKLDHSFSLVSLGDVAMDLGDSAEAKRCYDEALRLRRELCEAEPANMSRRRSLSMIYERLAELFDRYGPAEAAIAPARQCMEIRRELCDHDPENLPWQRNLSIAYERLGSIDMRLGRLRDAQRSFSNAVEISKTLLRKEPESVDSLRDHSISLRHFGDLLMASGQPSRAASFYLDCMPHLLKVRGISGDEPETLKDLCAAHNNLARAHLHTPDPGAALQVLLQFEAMVPEAASKLPSSVEAKRAIVENYSLHGRALLALHSTDLAWAKLEAASRLAGTQAVEGDAMVIWKILRAETLNARGACRFLRGDPAGAGEDWAVAESLLEANAANGERIPNAVWIRIENLLAQKNANCFSPNFRNSQDSISPLLSSLEKQLRQLNGSSPEYDGAITARLAEIGARTTHWFSIADKR